MSVIVISMRYASVINNCSKESRLLIKNRVAKVKNKELRKI